MIQICCWYRIALFYLRSTVLLVWAFGAFGLFEEAAEAFYERIGGSVRAPRTRVPCGAALAEGIEGLGGRSLARLGLLDFPSIWRIRSHQPRSHKSRVTIPPPRSSTRITKSRMSGTAYRTVSSTTGSLRLRLRSQASNG